MSEPDQVLDAPETRASLPERVATVVRFLEDGLLIVLLVAMVGLALYQIVARNFFSSGLLWGDGLLRVMVLWVGMLGALAATREDRHINVDVLSRFLPPRSKAGARVVTDLFTTLVTAALSWYAGRLVLSDRAAGSLAFATVPIWVCELVLPVAFALIAVRFLALAVVHARLAVTRSTGDPA